MPKFNRYELNYIILSVHLRTAYLTKIENFLQKIL